MLFNSFNFLIFFLPVCLLTFYAVKKKHEKYTNHVLLAFSVAFYAYWNWVYVFLLGISAFLNFKAGQAISDEANEAKKKKIATIAVLLNICVLAYFKYFNFFIENINVLFNSNLEIYKIILPLGISFFTFQKVAYIIDCYKNEVKEHDFIRFNLFVWFFPQLIAGPIVHHKEIIPQFKSNNGADRKMFAEGLLLIVLGLFKKVMIADTLAMYCEAQFHNVDKLQILDAWTAIVGYTLQLYFDFSAYSEMALGLALLFGIRLPINFNSPYKAVNISDFWRRWHMSLGRFLRDYVYIPIGGNKKGALYAGMAAFITMAVGGFWHGAEWHYLIWGMFHGALLTCYYLWKRLGLNLGKNIGLIVTLFSVMMGWVIFKCNSLHDALTMYKTMFGFNGIVLPGIYKNIHGMDVAMSPFINGIEIFMMLVLLVFVCTQRNVIEISKDFKYDITSAFGVGFIGMICLFYITSPSSFQYFIF